MGARLKFWRRSRVPKNGSRDEAAEIPPNLSRLYYNGSAAKSHSTTTQYRQLRSLKPCQKLPSRIIIAIACRQTLFYFSFRSFQKHRRARENERGA